jgi:hypothetical protein
VLRCNNNSLYLPQSVEEGAGLKKIIHYKGATICKGSNRDLTTNVRINVAGTSMNNMKCCEETT